MNLTLWLPLNRHCLEILVVQLEVHLQGFHCQNETLPLNAVHSLREADEALVPSLNSYNRDALIINFLSVIFKALK